MPAPRSPAAAPTAPPAAALPLAELLRHTAAAVSAVRNGRSLTDALAACPAPARPGTQALAFHALRHLGHTEALRSLWTKKPPPPLGDALLLTALSLLRPGGQGEDPAPRYEPHTVVDQAVRAAKKVAAAHSGLLNAVLRRALREPQGWDAAAQQTPAARWSHPAWWIGRLQQDWPGQAEAVLAFNNTRAPMTLRVNARQGNAAGYVAQLQAVGIPAQAIGRHTVLLDTPQPVQRLPGFAEGAISVQDAAAQLAAPLLLGAASLPAGARVLDACAAPGGKTAHLLELADLDVLALDVDAQRLSRVADNLARLRLAAELKAADASHPDTWWDGRPFDAILLDAPCSASGIVRRHPDVRWLRRESDLAALARTQDALLDALWPLLKPGGHLVYCTCSVFRQEGEQRRDAFLQRTPDAQALPAPGHLGPVADNSPTHQALDLLGATEPPSGTPPQGAPLFDGFYYALIHKRLG